MTEEMIDHAKLALSYVQQTIDSCAGLEIPYHIAIAMVELSGAIDGFINPNMEE